MDAGPRRAIAYIAGRAVSGQNASSVYDYDASAHFHFSGTVSASAANVFDNEINRHISGSFPRSTTTELTATSS